MPEETKLAPSKMQSWVATSHNQMYMPNGACWPKLLLCCPPVFQTYGRYLKGVRAHFHWLLQVGIGNVPRGLFLVGSFGSPPCVKILPPKRAATPPKTGAGWVNFVGQHVLFRLMGPLRCHAFLNPATCK